jgi:predicted ATPase
MSVEATKSLAQFEGVISMFLLITGASGMGKTTVRKIVAP